VGVLIEADVVENEELGFGAEECGIADAGILHEELRFLSDPAGVALVVLPGDGILDVAEHDHGGGIHEWIHDGGGGVGDQEHVALVDGRPAADAGAIDAEAIFERILRELADRVGDVVLQAGNIGKPEVHHLGFILSGKLQHFLWAHLATLSRGCGLLGS
jgi:hypothetical protein